MTAPLPPGRMGLPFLGESLAFGRNPDKFLFERYARYGSVFKTSLLGMPVVCLTGSEGFELLANPDCVQRSGANPPHLVALMGRISSPFLDGDAHSRRRAFVMQAFSDQALAGYADLVDPVLDAYFSRWVAQGRFGWVAELKKLSFDLCSRLYIGVEPGFGEGDDLTDLRRLYAGFKSVPIPLPWTGYGRGLRARDRLLRRFAQAVAEHRRRQGVDVLDRLLAARDAEGRPLGDEELRAELLQFYIASFAAIYSVGSCLVLALEQQREASDRLRSDPREEPMLWFTKEVRRFYPITATTLFAKAKRDLVVQGYLIPAGWRLIGSINVTMQSRRTFPDAGRFDPWRFDPDAPSPLPPGHYVAHGAGPRGRAHRCAGEALADWLMVRLLRRLLAHRWVLPPQDLEIAPEDGIPVPRSGLQVSGFSPAS